MDLSGNLGCRFGMLFSWRNTSRAYAHDHVDVLVLRGIGSHLRHQNGDAEEGLLVLTLLLVDSIEPRRRGERADRRGQFSDLKLSRTLTRPAETKGSIGSGEKFLERQRQTAVGRDFVR
jgi:hypothetical protein